MKRRTKLNSLALAFLALGLCWLAHPPATEAATTTAPAAVNGVWWSMTVCGHGVSWDPEEAWDLANQDLAVGVAWYLDFRTRNWSDVYGDVTLLPNGEWEATACRDFEMWWGAF